MMVDMRIFNKRKSGNTGERKLSMSIGISKRLIEHIDTFWRGHAYSSRSDFVDHAIRSYIEFIHDKEGGDER